MLSISDAIHKIIWNKKDGKKIIYEPTNTLLVKLELQS